MYITKCKKTKTTHTSKARLLCSGVGGVVCGSVLDDLGGVVSGARAGVVERIVSWRGASWLEGGGVTLKEG